MANQRPPRWRDEDNRGAFGYEGEGYMYGGGRDVPRGGNRGDWNVGRDFERETNRADDRFDPVGRSRDDERPRPSFRGRGPKGYQRSDERIREDVCERLSMDDYVDATDIEVNVAGGTVTLCGQVDDRNAKRRAEDIAESVNGVRDVENQIRVARREGTY